jgi:bile acid:Na+ symporter, BASS family
MVSEAEQKLLAAMIFFIMLGMGASLTWKDFFTAMKRPWGLFIGLICQFGFMPLIAVSLALLFNLNPYYAIGLIIMGSTPGGTTSNIFTYFSKGNLALSVLMTVNSTLFAMFMMPLLLLTYSGLFTSGGEFEIPIKNITLTLGILLIPVTIGMFIRKVNANVGALLELSGGVLGIAVILFLIVTWVPNNYEILAITPWQVYFSAIFLGLIGVFIGYHFARRLKIHPRSSRTIGLETGIQNGPLALTIVLLSFSGTEVDQVILIPALYSLFIVITSSFITMYFRRANTNEEQKIPDLL